MDNTEAVDKLDRIFAERIGKHPQSDLFVNDILAAIQADPLAYVKPKPLEWGPMEWGWDDYGCDVWGEFSSGLVSLSKCETYAIWERSCDEFIWTMGDSIRHSSYPEGVIPYCPTLEAAQAAAYEDLCNRVKELF